MSFWNKLFEDEEKHEFVKKLEEDEKMPPPGLGFLFPSSKEQIEQSFGENFGRLSDDGKIYSSGLLAGKEVGHIDDDGNVYREESSLLGRDVKIGRVDENGRFIEGENA